VLLLFLFECLLIKTTSLKTYKIYHSRQTKLFLNIVEMNFKIDNV